MSRRKKGKEWHILKQRKQINRKQQNNGSTLIVVLVAVSFLVIVASIILAMSSSNLRMKQIEYAMKENFYVDEIGLEDIYNGIGRDVSKALSKAYSQTLMEANVTGKYPTQKAAYIAFAGSFKNELIDLFGDAGEAGTEETLNLLNSYITRNETGESLKVDSYKGVSILADTETGADLWQYILKGVKVRYIEDGRYESVITTDIVIEVPYINFFQDFTQILDYSLVGNKGIFFNGTGAYIEGNIYAGIDSKEKNATYAGYHYGSEAYDGLNFYQSTVTFKDSSYIISKGDMNICESAVTIESKVSDTTKDAQSNLWVENIRTVEHEKTASPLWSNAALTPSKLTATANIFAADDLELNARNSNVTLSGNYYGYNYNNSGSGIYETWESKNIKDKYQTGEMLQAANTTSSAMIMNSMNSTLDLTGLNTLMVAGVAYIDIKDTDKSYSDLTAGEAKEFRTGESIAMRYNQFMYLAPPEILDGVSNPQINGSTNVDEVCKPGAENTKLADWFGHTYLDSTKPVIPVVYEDNGVSYTYYYLNITEGQEISYIKEIMEAADPGETGEAYAKQKWELKQEIIKKSENADISSHIAIAGGSSSGVKIYTTGLFTDTEQDKKTWKNAENDISLPDMAVRSNNMQKHYAQLYVNLDPNSVEALDDAKKTDSTYPLQNFLDLSALNTEKLPNEIEGKKVEGVKGAKVWILNDSINPVLNLSAESKKGIVLCRGDLTITGNGGTFEGLIIATGKITVNGNVTIKADRGIVQAVLEAEQRGVLATEKKELDSVKLNTYVSHYFKNTVLVDIDKLDKEKLIDMDKRVTSTEYTDYIYYDNWRRGES